MNAALQAADSANALMVAALLAAAILVWFWRWAAVVLVAVAAIAGAFFGLVSLAGLAVLAVYGFGCAVYRRCGFDVGGSALWSALVVATALLFLHLLPGLSGLRVIGPVSYGDGAVYEKWVSLDKVGAGLLLLALALPISAQALPTPGRMFAALGVAIATPVLVLGAAVAMGALSCDVTFAGFGIWAAFNLFTVCLAEEAFFRGLVQGRLTTWAEARGWSPHPAILIAALVFGIAHAPGGVVLVAASALAGLGYGYVYWLSGRIEAAILAHFALNAAHFLLLSYPYPAA